jgi:hypothetical protein
MKPLKINKMKQQILQETAEKHYEEQLIEFENNTDNYIFNTSRYLVAGFIEGANYQAERMYSQEEVKSFLDRYRSQFRTDKNIDVKQSDFIKWFEKLKKK